VQFYERYKEETKRLKLLRYKLGTAAKGKAKDDAAKRLAHGIQAFRRFAKDLMEHYRAQRGRYDRMMEDRDVYGVDFQQQAEKVKRLNARYRRIAKAYQYRLLGFGRGKEWFLKHPEYNNGGRGPIKGGAAPIAPAEKQTREAYEEEEPVHAAELANEFQSLRKSQRFDDEEEEKDGDGGDEDEDWMEIDNTSGHHQGQEEEENDATYAPPPPTPSSPPPPATPNPSSSSPLNSTWDFAMSEAAEAFEQLMNSSGGLEQDDESLRKSIETMKDMDHTDPMLILQQWEKPDTPILLGIDLTDHTQWQRFQASIRQSVPLLTSADTPGTWFMSLANAPRSHLSAHLQSSWFDLLRTTLEEDGLHPTLDLKAERASWYRMYFITLFDAFQRDGMPENALAYYRPLLQEDSVMTAAFLLAIRERRQEIRSEQQLTLYLELVETALVSHHLSAAKTTAEVSHWKEKEQEMTHRAAAELKVIMDKYGSLEQQLSLLTAENERLRAENQHLLLQDVDLELDLNNRVEQAVPTLNTAAPSQLQRELHLAQTMETSLQRVFKELDDLKEQNQLIVNEQKKMKKKKQTDAFDAILNSGTATAATPVAQRPVVISLDDD